jgi:hypothetical protein
MTSTALANWPCLAIFLIGDFNAAFARRVDTGRRFLASGDLALMLFHVDSCCPSPPSELAPTILFGVQSTTQTKDFATGIRILFREQRRRKRLVSTSVRRVTRFNERLIAILISC